MGPPLAGIKVKPTTLANTSVRVVEQQGRFKGTPIATEVGFPSSHQDAGLIVGFKLIYHIADFVGGDSSTLCNGMHCKSAGV